MNHIAPPSGRVENGPALWAGWEIVPPFGRRIGTLYRDRVLGDMVAEAIMPSQAKRDHWIDQ